MEIKKPDSKLSKLKTDLQLSFGEKYNKDTLHIKKNVNVLNY